ncbi:transcription elongation factor GreA [Patescibacteria group bacterium]|nr:transcription elongation factor GreA [Patescibacteria group bacterium]
MNQPDYVYITRAGLEKLKAELKELKEAKRPESAQKIKEARDMGDISENSLYDSARQEQALIEGRIAELEDIIKHSKVSEGATKDSVDVGCRVTVHIDGDEEEFHIVGPLEADPMNRKISHQSPLGEALYGKKVGDKIEVEAPVGILTYTILTIKY